MLIEVDGNVRGVTPVEFRVMPRALRFVVGDENERRSLESARLHIADFSFPGIERRSREIDSQGVGTWQM